MGIDIVRFRERLFVLQTVISTPQLLRTVVDGKRVDHFPAIRVDRDCPHTGKPTTRVKRVLLTRLDILHFHGRMQIPIITDVRVKLHIPGKTDADFIGIRTTMKVSPLPRLQVQPFQFD